jgi:hypothetical protein
METEGAEKAFLAIAIRQSRDLGRAKGGIKQLREIGLFQVVAVLAGNSGDQEREEQALAST